MSTTTASTDEPEKSGEPEKSDEFPRGIPFIVGNEGAERFSYYGMRAILYVYLASLYVQFAPEATLAEGVAEAARAQATAVAHLFMAGVYAFPMIGAVLADRLLGKYPVILWVSGLYCLGHAVLAVAGRFGEWGNFEVAEYGMYAGLALIAIGSGGIKPCVSANVGDQFSSKNGHLVTKVFQIFYFIINFGSFFATLLTPLLYRWYGPEVAFGVPGVVMGIATVVFFLGRKRFVHVPPKPGGSLGAMDFLTSMLLFSPVVALIVAVFVQGGSFEAQAAEGRGALEFYWTYVRDYLGHIAATSWMYFVAGAVGFVLGLILFQVRQARRRDSGFLAVLSYAIRNRRQRKPGEGFFDVAREAFGEEAAEGPSAVLRIMLVFSMVSVFWALFDQHASTWIEQASQMQRSITVPESLGYTVVGVTLLLALFGGTWLMLWVSNVRVPRAVTVGVLGLSGVALLAAGGRDLFVGGWMEVELAAAQIQALNPLMVMMIIPGLNFFVYRPLEKRNVVIRPLQKMTVGMFLAAVAFVAAAILQQRIEAGEAAHVHVLWQVVQYLLMTTSEVLVSVTGLEFAYTQAPRAMKSTIMGFWLLGVTFGNVLVAFLAPIQTVLELSAFFWVFASLMAVAAVLFAILAKLYKGKSYLQSDAA